MKTLSYIFSCTAIFLVSCLATTSYVKTYPPEIILPEPFKKMVVISAFDYTTLAFNQDKKVDAFKVGSRTLIETLSENLHHRAAVQTILVDSIIPGFANLSPPDYVPTHIRKQLCKYYKVPLLLVLESYDLYFDQEVDVEEADDGSKSRTAYYDLIGDAGIYLYDSTGNRLNKGIVKEIHYEYDSRSVISGLLAVGPSMGNAREEILKMSEDMAFQYVDKYFPSNERVTKYFYHNKYFRKITEDIIAEHWNSAIHDLLLFTRSNDKKLVGKSSYNLSVVYEAIGNMDSAQFWYDHAAKHIKNLPGEIGEY